MLGDSTVASTRDVTDVGGVGLKLRVEEPPYRRKIFRDKTISEKLESSPEDLYGGFGEETYRALDAPRVVLIRALLTFPLLLLTVHDFERTNEK